MGRETKGRTVGDERRKNGKGGERNKRLRGCRKEGRRGGGADGKWGDEREEVRVLEEKSDDFISVKDDLSSLCGWFGVIILTKLTENTISFRFQNQKKISFFNK